MGGKLVIARRIGRSVRIGRGIVVTVVGVNTGGEVDLAIEAPQDCAVSRDDIPLKIHQQHQLAREDGERITHEEAVRRASRTMEYGDGQ